MALNDLRTQLEAMAGVPALPDRRGEISRRAHRRRLRERALLVGAVGFVALGGAVAIRVSATDGLSQETEVAAPGPDEPDISTRQVTATEGLLEVAGIQARYSLNDAAVGGIEVPDTLRSEHLTVTGATETDFPGQPVREGTDDLQNTEVIILIAAAVSPTVDRVEAVLPDGTTSVATPADGIVVLVLRHTGIVIDGPVVLTATAADETSTVMFEPFIQRPLTCATNPDSIVLDSSLGGSVQGARVLAPPLLAPCTEGES